MPSSLYLTCLVAVLSLLSAVQSSALAGELAVDADLPAVNVSTRPVRRNFMQLPALQYRFRIEASCDAGESADALSLSVADTRVSLGQERLAEWSNEITVTIPAGQIPPVRIEGFCTADSDDASDSDSIRIPSVLSVQSSLLCVGDAGETMTYASTSLDVLVHCTRPETPEQD